MQKFLESKTIVLGISGGIAAYKSVEIVSQLKKLGADVHVVCTDNALKFVAPLSLQVMSGNAVHSQQDYFTESADGRISHIELADKADLILIAPCSANTIGKLAHGISDNLLLDLCLATKAQLLLVPAMNTNMWKHKKVQENLSSLRRDLGYLVLEPDSGTLACGHVGKGRLPEPEAIVAVVHSYFSVAQQGGTSSALDRGVLPGLWKPWIDFKKYVYKNFAGSLLKDVLDERREVFVSDRLNGSEASSAERRKLIVTAGGTREPIDPVRYISNRSSGRMGLALALEALAQGFEVILISTVHDQVSVEAQIFEDIQMGNSQLRSVDLKFLKLIEVETAQEMYEAVEQEFEDSDVLIMAAAVADFSPKASHGSKIKKQDLKAPVPELEYGDHLDEEENLSLNLRPTTDILATVSKSKRKDQLVIGFALETDDLLENAKRKLIEKNVDYIVANSEDSLGSDETSLMILERDANQSKEVRITKFENKSKRELASLIFEHIAEHAFAG